jgi:hypothetical protein
MVECEAVALAKINRGGEQGESLMQDILQRAERNQDLCMKKTQAHYKTSEMYKGQNIRLSIPVIVGSTIVATSVFASLSQTVGNLLISIGTGARFHFLLPLSLACKPFYATPKRRKSIDVLAWRTRV